MTDLVAYIPARAGSKGLPGKNIRTIAGKPLISWVIEAAHQCKEIQKIYVSTDGEDIHSVVENMGLEKVEVISRSPETATDTASSESALLEFTRKFSFRSVVFIQATSPLLQSDDLERGVKLHLSTNYGSVLSVVRQKRFIWSEKEDGTAHPVNYDVHSRPRRQDFSGFLVENGAFYIASHDSILESSLRISQPVYALEMPEESYHELDDATDWKVIEQRLIESKVLQTLSNTKVQLFVTDVDGVLTDAGMYYSESGDELKKFNTRDGMGLALLKKAGLQVAIMTSESTKIVEKRAEKLGINLLFQGLSDKKAALEELTSNLGITMENVAYIGDDINDLEAMRLVGYSACPADAAPEIKSVATFICKAPGGGGCVREFAELILRSKSL